jgi:Flp pilus assembly protein CpaB
MTDRSTRIRNLGAAGGLALVAAILTMLYVTRAQGSTRAASVGSAPVLVATRDLTIGTSFSSALASGAIAVEHVPATALAAGSLATTRLPRGQVVVQPIYKGEQVTTKRLGPSGLQGFRSALHGSLRAIAVPGDPRQLLAGTLERGDHVDLVVNDKLDQRHPKTRVALRDLIVLQAPGDSAEARNPNDPTLSATVQLTDQQVQVLWWAVKNGDWSFVLRPSARGGVSAVAPTGEQQILAGR